MTSWQQECARRKRESWKIFWAGVTAMVFVLLLGYAATTPASASVVAASQEDMEAAACQLEIYDARRGMADLKSCSSMLFLPTSAAFKCSLYKDSGYPSRLMKKACLLFDLGYIQSFTEGADNALN